MKIKLLCLVIFFNFSVYATSNEILNESQIHKNLRCLVCQGQSIADSNSEFAQTLKMVVKDLIKQGKTEDEIYNFLSDKYGDWILYKPPFKSNSYILWILPYVIFLFGIFILFYILRKKSLNNK